MPNPQTEQLEKKIHEFDGVIALCDQTLEELKKGRGQNSEDRKKQVEDKFSQILQNPTFAKGDDIILTWENLKKEGLPVSISTDLETYHSAAKSQEWYKSEDIFCILDHEVRAMKKVAFSNMILVGKYDNFDSKKDFVDQFEEAKKAANKGTATLMPINLRNKHWVAGVMRKDPLSGKIQFIYCDSLGAEIDPELLGWIGEFDKEIEIKNLSVVQQKDDYNCGPFMIDNLLKIASKKNQQFDEIEADFLSSKQADPEKLRENHAKISHQEIGDRDEAEKICQALKERAICGKMLNLFEQFRKEERMSDNKIKCEDRSSAKALAENIKKSYEDLGVIPCELKENEGSWIIRLPQECRGKDPFAMDSAELNNLKSLLKQPSPTASKKISAEILQNSNSLDQPVAAI